MTDPIPFRKPAGPRRAMVLAAGIGKRMRPVTATVPKPLIEVAGERRLDGLIVAGDISNDANRSLAVLHELKRRCGIPVWFVPGNHDYWSKINGNRDTWSIYRQFQTFEGCLSERPAVLDNGWVILGNSGWYDYTMGEPGYTFDDFERMHAMDRTWQDSLYVTWGMSNRDIHKYFYDSLERELAEHRGKSIVMVTHMLGHPYFKVPMPHPQWRTLTLFSGVRNTPNCIGDTASATELWDMFIIEKITRIKARS